MDKEIADIKRRAGIVTEETFDMASYEKLKTFIDDEVEFLGKLGQVLGRAMAPDRARQVLGVIQDRRTRLTQFVRQAQTDARQGQGQKDRAGQKRAADAYADVAGMK